MVTFKYAEQSEGSTVIDFILSDGNKEKVQEKDVLKFIEEYGLNIEKNHWMGNSRCSKDPAYDILEDIEWVPFAYLDKNFEHVCELYYKHLIEKR